MKQTKRFISLLLVAFMLTALLPSALLTAFAATNVSGTVYASDLADNASLNLNGNTTLVMDIDKTLSSIGGSSYSLNITGNKTLTFNTNECAIYAKDIAIASSVVINSTSKEHFAIAASNSFNFNGESLYVRCGFGIRAIDGNIDIIADKVDIDVTEGAPFLTYNGSIDINVKELVAVSDYAGNDDLGFGVWAYENIIIYAETAKISGNLSGVYSKNGNIELNGDFIIASARDGVVSANGDIDMYGNYQIKAIEDTGWGIYAGNSVSYYGGSLDVVGCGGIKAEHAVYLDGYSVKSIGRIYSGIISVNEYVTVEADKVWVQSLYKSIGDQPSDGIHAKTTATVVCSEATISGINGIYSEMYISLTGKFNIIGDESAIAAHENDTPVNSDIYMNGEFNLTSLCGTFFTLYAYNNIHFSGSLLRINGGYGIRTWDGDIELDGDVIDINVTNDSYNGAIEEKSGNVYLSGDTTIKVVSGSCIIADEIYISGYLEAISEKADEIPLYARNEIILEDVDAEITVPEGGSLAYNKDGIINAAGNYVGDHVVIQVPIELPDIYTENPVAGTVPFTDEDSVYYLDGYHTYLKSIVWYENGVKMDADDVFVAGNSYKAEITIATYSGYRFPTEGTGKVNGKSVSTSFNDNGREIILKYDYGKCPAVIGQVNFEVTAPVDGKNPSYVVTTKDTNAYYVVGNASTITDYVQWYVSDDGINYTEMSKTDKFIGGKYYKLYFDIAVKDGYRFMTYDGDPDMVAVINGMLGKVHKTYDQASSEYATVEYYFGKCNDSIIEEIIITDVTEPMPGEKPTYYANVQGTGYFIDENKNSYTDAYWLNPPEKWYYIKNGIGWYDWTARKWVHENETFIAGHDYEISVYLKTEDGFTFDVNNYYEPLVTATVNGNTAEIMESGSNAIYNQRVDYEFQWEVMDVTEIDILGVAFPSEGNSPDYDISVGNEALYGLADYGYNNSGLWWYDSEGNTLDESYEFIAGETYTLEIKLTPAMLEHIVVTRFGSPLTATINGIDFSDYVMANKDTAYIICDFICSEDPLFSISGFVKGGMEDDEIKISIYAEDTAKPFDEITLDETGYYAFEDLPEGVYYISVTVDGEEVYAINFVVDEDITHNIILASGMVDRLLGDVNNDGDVNKADYVQLKRFCFETVVLDEASLLAADVNQDGEVNKADYVHLKRFCFETMNISPEYIKVPAN